MNFLTAGLKMRKWGNSIFILLESIQYSFNDVLFFFFFFLEKCIFVAAIFYS